MKTLTEFSIVMLRRGADARAAKTTEGIEPEAMAEAIAGAIGVPADRAQRLLEALDVVGDGLEKIRLVRVYQGEKGPIGAATVGEFHYALDRIAAPGGQARSSSPPGGGRGGGDRGGRGGGDRGGGGGFGDKKGPPKPRGLSAFMAGAEKPKTDDDDGGPRGAMPRAGMGWVLTAAPRDARDNRAGGGPRGPGRGPRRDDRGGRPGGGGPGGGGPGGPRGPGGGGGGGRPAGAAGARDDRGGGRGPGGDNRGPGGDNRGPRPVTASASASAPAGAQAAADAPAPANSGAGETPKT